MDRRTHDMLTTNSATISVRGKLIIITRLNVQDVLQEI